MRGLGRFGVLAGWAALGAVGALAGLPVAGCSGGAATGSSESASGVVAIQDAHQVQLCDGTVIDSFSLGVLELAFTDTAGATHTVFSSAPTSTTIDLLQLHSEMDVLGAFQMSGAQGIVSVSMTLDSAQNGMTEAGTGAALPLDLSRLSPATAGGVAGSAFAIRFAPPLALRSGTNNIVVFDFRPGDSVACVSTANGTVYELDPDIRGFVLVGRQGLPVRTLPCTVAAVDCAGGTLRVGVRPFAGNLFEVSIANAQIDAVPGLGRPVTCADIAVGAHALLSGSFDASTGTFDATRVLLPGLGAPVGPGGSGGHGGGPGGGGPGGGGAGGGGAVPGHPLDLVGTIQNLNLQVAAPALAELDLASPRGGVAHVVVSAGTQIVDLRNPQSGPVAATVADLADNQFVKVSGIRDPATGAIDPATRIDILR